MSLFDLLNENAKADTALLQSNDNAGDVFTTPREVDFCFTAKERERAEDFAAFVNGKQYGKAHVEQSEDGTFRVLVLITMPITQHVICSISGFMLCLSRLFSIEYLGWGSVIQPAV